jgi:lipopolysaccharide transport system permease protein
MTSFKTIHIRPRKGTFDIEWLSLWRYRDLMRMLVYREFATRYKQTILGPAWYVIQPLLTTLIFIAIFGYVAKISTDGTPPILFYLCGLLGWNYFSMTLAATSNVFQSNAQIFGKVYFPRILVPLSSAVSQGFGWSVQILTFLIFFGYFLLFTEDGSGLEPQWGLVAVPLLVVQAALTALGAGFWLSALTAKYRDLQQIQAFLLQAWMYLTPVVYPLSQIPERWQWLSGLNPMTMVVENMRIAFLGSGTFRADLTVMSVVITVVLFISGFVRFQMAERSFIDSV